MSLEVFVVAISLIVLSMVLQGFGVTFIGGGAQGERGNLIMTGVAILLLATAIAVCTGYWLGSMA